KANYYEILGVEPNATEEEIRKAFVKKSHELHPDRKVLSKDRRMGWRRTSDTESFMEVKEAYDCLRKSASRAQYDSRLVNAAGHLHEASHMKFKQGTIVDLNRDRDEAYLGPRSRIPMSSHFRDLEQEYYKEKHRNRMLVIAAGLAFILVLANIGYV
ncbi:DnaJ domain protein, partial [Ostertagia ostertagi]